MNPTISIVNRSRSTSDAEVKRNLGALELGGVSGDHSAVELVRIRPVAMSPGGGG